MDSIHWLFAANALVWIGLGAYAAYLGHIQRKLAVKLRQLEIISHEQHN